MAPSENPRLDPDLVRSLVIGGVCVAGAIGMLVGHLRPERRPTPEMTVTTAMPPPPAIVATPVPNAPKVDDMGGWGGRPRQNDIPPVDLSGVGGGGRHHSPRLVGLPATVAPSERLPVDVVNRIVRQNFGRFRLCYENGLRKQPSLAGRIAIKFIIDRAGAVSTSGEDTGTTLSDHEVVSCVVRSFQHLSFPSPEGGIAKATYRIDFTP